jgi:hypothetical protein
MSRDPFVNDNRCSHNRVNELISLARNQSRATALDLAAVWRRMSPAVGPDAMVEGKQERHAVAATG